MTFQKIVIHNEDGSISVTENVIAFQVIDKSLCDEIAEDNEITLTDADYAQIQDQCESSEHLPEYDELEEFIRSLHETN